MTTVVELDRVSKSFGDQSVLRELSFSIERGEIFCLLGPNGAGKTTTLEILEGFLEPDSGSVQVLGCDPLASGEVLRPRVGVVLQESGFPKFFRVGEMIDTWRSYYDNPLPYDDILDLVGLRSDEAKLVRKLSGGQRRRLDFALAVAGDPEVIFLDEPTTGFDPEARARCWEAIAGLRELGKTILLTTHYLDEAERLGDRIAVLLDGAAGAIGSTQELAQLANLGVTVSFQASAEVAEQLAREFSGLKATDEFVDGQIDDVRALTRRLELLDDHASQRAFASLRVQPPSLEQAYIALVGRQSEPMDPTLQ
ncbi:MAG: ABC transporter ATP-binding protein [bacterium]|nr:ABC transporter ATP-binding protein [bacterium]